VRSAERQNAAVAALPPLRSKLLLLAAVGVVPGLILSLVLGYFLIEHEKETFRETAFARNRTFLTAVDAQMLGYVGTLHALEASASLDTGNLESFHAEATRVLASQPDWRNVLLLDTAGQQLLNLRVPYGTTLPNEAQVDNPGFRKVIESRKPVIGNLNTGPVSNVPGIAVRLPVLRDGELRYVLEFVLEPVALTKLMQAQAYAKTWTVGLADGNNRVIARLPALPPGDRISASAQAAINRAPEGWYHGRTVEGSDTYTAYKTSLLTGWTVGLSIPAGELNAAAYKASASLALGTLVSLLAALGFAFWQSHEISTPIAMLAAAARRLGREPQPEALTAVRNDPRVKEVFDVALALEGAAASLQEREALRQREQHALLAADRAKDEFLAMLGHELRNPLSSIVASAHVLRLSKPGAAAALQAHEVIERQSQQMARLVEDLLDVSRMAMGKVTLQRERLDLAELAERVLETWRQTRRSRAGRTQSDLARVWIHADRVRVEQILLNLLDNAEKFSSGEERITVRVGVEGDQAVLQVRDRGQGITPEEIPHIFKLFVQGPQSFHRPQGGIGLGLTLVQRLAEMHGGDVSVFSAGRGQGAAFTVRLPVAEAPGRATSSTEPRSDALLPQGRRILLVEDNEDGRHMMETMLTLEGHMVRTAATGEEAVRAALEWLPDVALVDIGLPDIDGHEVARRLRALLPDNTPKLVAISGFGQPGDLHNAYEAGFDLHLTKPVSPKFLHDVMNALTSKGPVKG
jgi:signal transduction histidine kinase/ActR/RegA family two-component response regulator